MKTQFLLANVIQDVNALVVIVGGLGTVMFGFTVWKLWQIFPTRREIDLMTAQRDKEIENLQNEDKEIDKRLRYLETHQSGAASAIKHEIIHGSLEWMSLTILLIGLINLSGYIFDLRDLYAWKGSAPMAWPTALALVLTGIILLGILVTRKRKEQ